MMQTLSTTNDVLPGFIRAFDQAVNVEHQLPVALPNNGGQPQMGREHANIGDERGFDSRTPQATTPVSNAAGLHRGTTAPREGALDSRMPQAVAPMSNAADDLYEGTTTPRLQIPLLVMGGTAHRSWLVPETLMTS
ncbi:hypothetical protein ACOSQ2_026971 [Xanthoceras sorbifolium]